MKNFITLAFVVSFLLTSSFAQDKASLTSIESLNQFAMLKINAQPNVPLADEKADFIAGADITEPGKVPNYVRALALLPKAAKPLAVTFNAYLYKGTIAPETKMAMGLRIAQVYGSAYPAVHLQRLLRASEKGRKLLSHLQTGDIASASPSEQAAINYAELLTRDTHGGSDAEFQKVRSSFNDSQIVELVMTTSFFNYFLRFCEGANLPVEKWALDEPVANASPSKFEIAPARVALVSDEGMSGAADILAAAKEPSSNQPGSNWLGIRVANSQRAFLLAPDISKAWRAYTTTTREYDKVSREIKLHVSFAISMTNGCRY